MKIHRILIVLSLTAFVFVSTGCFNYYSYLQRISLQEAEKQASSIALTINNRLSVFISENMRLVKALAGFKEVQQFLAYPDKSKLNKANKLLDYFRDTIDLSVCYIMDTKGNTVASSNRNEPESFMGENYAFRPYFVKAIQGYPGISIYLALGVTSNIRGVYYSYPIYSGDNSSPSGIAVIKVSLSELEKELSEVFRGIWGIIGPHGVIFASNKQDWLYRTLWQAGPQERNEILESRQFGGGPWKWTGLEKERDGYVEDNLGRQYMIQKMKNAHHAEWEIFYLTDVKSVLSLLSDPLVKNRGLIMLLLFLFISSLVLSLYIYGRSQLIRRKKRERTLQRQNEYFAALHETSIGLVGRLDLNELIEAILLRAGSLVGTSSGVLSLYNEERNELEIAIGLGLFKQVIGYRTKPGEGFSGKIWQTGKPLIVDNYAQWSGRLPNSKLENLHSFIGIPLKSEGSLSGVIGLAHSEIEKKFGKNELDILGRFAELASIALDNARLYAHLQKANYELNRIATMDGLTQIANRRQFDTFLDQQWKHMNRDQSHISLIMCDVDCFKLYNDTYGHQAGDECLKKIAKLIDDNINRPTDLAARYGGEEFAVILPDTVMKGALKIAEDIRLATKQLKIEHTLSNVTPYVTLSLGVSSIIPDGKHSKEMLIEAADEALYIAKQTGKNCVSSKVPSYHPHQRSCN